MLFSVQVPDACDWLVFFILQGNYVKMVHNGIEYGEMQLIAEAYDVLKNALSMENEEIADLFDEWNKSELSSYLMEVTATILRRKDDETGEGYVLDYIVDKTGMKGTGKVRYLQRIQPVAMSTLSLIMLALLVSHAFFCFKSGRF
jgi:6-phosphogluconate dehydrogenase